MSCGICGGEVTTNGDGDLLCQGSCGEVLTREEIEASFEDGRPVEQPEEWDDEYDDDEDDFEYEDDGQPDEYTEWQDYMGGDDDPADWDQFGGAFEEY